MTTETMIQPPADADAQRKAELMAEGAKRGLKFDRRFAVKRMEDLIAEHDAKGAPPSKAVEQPKTEAPSEVEALKAKLAAAEALLADKRAEPRSGPKGMLTSQQIVPPGTFQREEDERRLLMDQATSLGIAAQIRPGAGIDAIREHINRHMAAKFQAQQMQDELDKRRARAPAKEKVALRVLHLGDGKISKGIHIPGIGDATYARGDIIPEVDLDIATEHQAAGRGEIVTAA